MRWDRRDIQTDGQADRHEITREHNNAVQEFKLRVHDCNDRQINTKLQQ